MPTPALNGAASISQRTGGLRRPPSMAPLTTFRTAPIGLAPRCGVKPISRMNHQATTKVTPSITARMMYGTPRFVSWATKPPRTDPLSIAAPANDLGPGEDRLEVAGEIGGVEGVDQPGLRGAREEREPEPQQGGCDRPTPERRVDIPHQQIEEGGHEEGACPEEEGEPTATGIGHDPGGHLEDDLAEGEEGVRRKGLRVAQARVEQEEGIDPPDERRGERRQQGQDQEGALDDAGLIGHRVTVPDRSVTRPRLRR